MKRLVLTLSDGAYEAIKSEVTFYDLGQCGEGLLTVFAGKVIRAIEGGEEALEIKTRTEREEDKEPCRKP